MQLFDQDNKKKSQYFVPKYCIQNLFRKINAAQSLLNGVEYRQPLGFCSSESFIISAKIYSLEFLWCDYDRVDKEVGEKTVSVCSRHSFFLNVIMDQEGPERREHKFHSIAQGFN